MLFIFKNFATQSKTLFFYLWITGIICSKNWHKQHGKGLTGALQVALRFPITFCGGVNCEVWWLMAGLAVLGVRVDWKLLKTAALFVAWITFEELFWEKRHKYRSRLQLKGRLTALGHDTRRAWGEWTVFCCGLLRKVKYVVAVAGIDDGITGDWRLTNCWGRFKGGASAKGLGVWGTFCVG